MTTMNMENTNIVEYIATNFEKTWSEEYMLSMKKKLESLNEMSYFQQIEALHDEYENMHIRYYRLFFNLFLFDEMYGKYYYKHNNDYRRDVNIIRIDDYYSDKNINFKYYDYFEFYNIPICLFLDDDFESLKFQLLEGTPTKHKFSKENFDNYRIHNPDKKEFLDNNENILVGFTLEEIINNFIELNIIENNERAKELIRLLHLYDGKNKN